MDTLPEDVKVFNNLCTLPSTFLTGEKSVSLQFVNITANGYKNCKLLNQKTDNDPLQTLLTKDFDEEQIWQQIDLLNADVTTSLKSEVSKIERAPQLSFYKSQTINDVEDENLLSNSFEDDSNASREDVSDASDENDEEANGKFEDEEIYEKTVVDDNFFSLRKMEKFLDLQESENFDKEIEEDEVDYFKEMNSSESEFSDENLKNNENDATSARQLKYNDFFDDLKSQETTADSDKKMRSDEVLEIQQKNMVKRVEKMEERALADQDWQMKGETTAQKRPVNSLLEEVLQFDQTERTAPEITDEHTQELETIIIQRIKDRTFDDVTRKIKEIDNIHDFKKKIVLDSEKSKLSLHEIYEREYIEKLSNEPKEDKEDPSHVEIKGLMKNLFRKLDALSNYHFKSAMPEPEIKVVKNIPSVTIEEVQPIHHSDANLLAPEEVYAGGKLKADAERSSTDKKRERRKKKIRQKTRSKARSVKLEALADTSAKLKSLQAINKLQQQAKLPGSQTTLIKNSKQKQKVNNLSSSKAFFSKLEEAKANKGLKNRQS